MAEVSNADVLALGAITLLAHVVPRAVRWATPLALVLCTTQGMAMFALLLTFKTLLVLLGRSCLLPSQLRCPFWL
jgi:hypothetical protein